MGEVISKTAAAADILADLDATLANARARGGALQEDAERMLAPSLALAREVEAERVALAGTLASSEALVAHLDREADAVVARLYDEAYNLVGRPGNGSDPVFALLFPNGSSTYRTVPVSEQPRRMRMLARLLERNLHSGIPAVLTSAWAGAVRESARRLRAALDELEDHETEDLLLDAMRSTTARSGQVHLARLKRLWRSRGMSEADVHRLIPDRPRPRRHRPEPAAPVS
jgi:hypothetical protein